MIFSKNFPSFFLNGTLIFARITVYWEMEILRVFKDYWVEGAKITLIPEDTKYHHGPSVGIEPHTSQLMNGVLA